MHKESITEDCVESQSIRLLSDEPLDVDREQQMRFGHRGIVETLRTMVFSCPTPFTIGLHGKWGTGKTTILDALIRTFHGTTVAAIKIDSWKHEGDALRRTFLQDAIGQLQKRQGKRQYLASNVRLSENVRVPITKTLRNSFRLNRYFLKPLGIGLAIFVAVGFIIQRFSPESLGSYISIVSGGGILTGVLLWLLQQSVTTETTTKTIDRFQDPQEFEAEFKSITSQVAADKLLIIIDNLDRVSCEKAIELLSTIKTFLEQEKCVFLIACDAEAIKRHLEHQYQVDCEHVPGLSTGSGDEFLRKFFNSYLVIPEFIDTELQTYTEGLLAESRLPAKNPADVAFVIAKAFQDNPRQIKQFINTLIAHFLLAQKREASQELPAGSVTDNLAYLAKDLVVRLQFPECYDCFTQQESASTYGEKLKDFLRATQPIDVEDTRPFRYLKLSEEEIKMPATRDLQLAVQDNNIESVAQIIDTVRADSMKLTALNRFVYSLINRNRGREALLTNIVSSILSALSRLGVTFDRRFYDQVADLLGDDGQLGAKLNAFPPSLVFHEVLSRCNKARREEIIHRYSLLFSDPNRIRLEGREAYITSLIQAFIDHRDWLNAARKQEIASAIGQKHCNHEVLSMFVGRPVEQREFVNEDTLTQFIAQISAKDVEEEILNRRSALLSEFKEIVTDKNLAEIMTQLTALLSTENSKPDRSQKRSLLECVYSIISVFGGRIAKLRENLVHPFAEQIVKGTNALGPMAQKRAFVPVCLWLVGVVSDPLKSQINTTLDGFFMSASRDDFQFVFDRIGARIEKEQIITASVGTLRQRALQDQKVFDVLYHFAPQDVRTDWLTALVQVDHRRAVAKLEELGYRIDNKKVVVSEILKKVAQVPIPQKEMLYVACNRMKCANDTTLKVKMVSCVKGHLKDPNAASQVLGLTILKDATYLSQSQKRDIATDVIEWLSSLPPDSAFQPSSIESILVMWPVLTVALEQTFLYYVFDKLIRRGTNNQSIDSGFSILNRMKEKPKYEDFSSYFDDVLARAVPEPNPDVKSHLVKGLGSLKPKAMNSRNKDYWQRVRELTQAG